MLNSVKGGVATVFGSLIFFSTCFAQGPEFDTEEMPDTGMARKEPSILLRPARDTPAEQLAYARKLMAEGAERKAARHCRALVRTWHDSSQAPQAQLEYAKYLERRRKYWDAFDEYQYLFEHYAGRFPFDDVLERQFRIANELRGRIGKRVLLVFGGTSPERCVGLYETIVDNAPNHDIAPEAQFLVGTLYEESGDFRAAIHAYAVAAQRYPRSDFAADASFRRAACLARISERRCRDEATCREALSALAAFTADYPDHPRAAEARRKLDAIKARLVDMTFQRAEFYDKTLGQPEAAIIAYSDFVAKFPFSEKAETARMRIDELKQQAGENNDEN